MKVGMYGKFGLMMLTSFLLMYGIMFLNADQFDHVMLSVMRTYMALLMISCMAVVMLLYMLPMYKNKRLNTFILVFSGVAFIAFYVIMRNQVGVSDVQYIRGMIPHHSSAILTSQQVHLEDPVTIELAKEIIAAQKGNCPDEKNSIQTGNRRLTLLD
jgi:hypothetical protein